MVATLVTAAVAGMGSWHVSTGTAREASRQDTSESHDELREALEDTQEAVDQLHEDRDRLWDLITVLVTRERLNRQAVPVRQRAEVDTDAPLPIDTYSPPPPAQKMKRARPAQHLFAK